MDHANDNYPFDPEHLRKVLDWLQRAKINPYAKIGVQAFANIIGRAEITVRRRKDEKDRYYDPSLPPPRREGITLIWYRYEAYYYLSLTLGLPRFPDEVA
jgi:hypothetical protein